MSWNGIKKQTNIEDIKSWCEEMGIRNYTINSKGEIDVDGDVNLRCSDFEELPYKFGKVKGYFEIEHNSKLTSLKNCPNEVCGYFSCSYNKNLKSLKGCPLIVRLSFFCKSCGIKISTSMVNSMCNILTGTIYNT